MPRFLSNELRKSIPPRFIARFEDPAAKEIARELASWAEREGFMFAAGKHGSRLPTYHVVIPDAMGSRGSIPETVLTIQLQARRTSGSFGGILSIPLYDLRSVAFITPDGKKELLQRVNAALPPSAHVPLNRLGTSRSDWEEIRYEVLADSAVMSAFQSALIWIRDRARSSITLRPAVQIDGT